MCVCVSVGHRQSAIFFLRRLLHVRYGREEHMNSCRQPTTWKVSTGRKSFSRITQTMLSSACQVVADEW